jgi:glutamate racemase
MTIGIFDSGVGGLTVLKSLVEILPDESFIYLGDTARYPYGGKTPTTLARYAKESVNFLLKEGCSTLVVACNTLSSTVLDIIEQQSNCPVIGTIMPTAELILNDSSLTDIGIIGTRATVKSSAYNKAILHAKPNLKLRTVACPLFVPLVEEGITTGKIVDEVIDLYLKDWVADPPDALILGCTHYPLLTTSLYNYFSGKTKIINTAEAIAKKVANSTKISQVTDSSKQIKYFVTDSPEQFKIIGEIIMKVKDIKVEQVTLS